MSLVVAIVSMLLLTATQQATAVNVRFYEDANLMGDSSSFNGGPLPPKDSCGDCETLVRCRRLQIKLQTTLILITSFTAYYSAYYSCSSVVFHSWLVTSGHACMQNVVTTNPWSSYELDSMAGITLYSELDCEGECSQESALC